MTFKLPVVAVARPGDVFLFISPNYWGRGETLRKAFSGHCKAGGSKNPTQWLVYSVHSKAYCEEIRGDIVSPKGHKPIKIAEHLPHKTPVNETPEGYAQLAEQAEKERRWKDAADMWHRAQGVTLGHNRAERYRQAEDRCRKQAH